MFKGALIILERKHYSEIITDPAIRQRCNALSGLCKTAKSMDDILSKLKIKINVWIRINEYIVNSYYIGIIRWSYINELYFIVKIIILKLRIARLGFSG